MVEQLHKILLEQHKTLTWSSTVLAEVVAENHQLRLQLHENYQRRAPSDPLPDLTFVELLTERDQLRVQLATASAEISRLQLEALRGGLETVIAERVTEFKSRLAHIERETTQRIANTKRETAERIVAWIVDGIGAGAWK